MDAATRVEPAEPGQGVLEDLPIGLVDPDLVGERPVVEVPQHAVTFEVAEQGRRRREADVADDPQPDAPLEQHGQRLAHPVEEGQLGPLPLAGEGRQQVGADPSDAGDVGEVPLDGVGDGMGGVEPAELAVGPPGVVPAMPGGVVGGAEKGKYNAGAPHAGVDQYLAHGLQAAGPEVAAWWLTTEGVPVVEGDGLDGRSPEGQGTYSPCSLSTCSR